MKPPQVTTCGQCHTDCTILDAKGWHCRCGETYILLPVRYAFELYRMDTNVLLARLPFIDSEAIADARRLYGVPAEGLRISIVTQGVGHANG